MSIIGINEVKTECNKNKWKCIDNVYKNLNTQMSFLCPNNHLIKCTWKELRNNFKCPICYEKNTFSTHSHKEKIRILALDQSSHKTGYAIYENDVLIKYGVYEAKKSNAIDRMVEICDWLTSMINYWRPDIVGIEETLYNKNFDSCIGVHNHDVFRLLTQVMGGIIVTVAKEKCQIDIVKIATWRHFCGVKGRSRVDQKRSAQSIVKKWYNIYVTDDESDAICIGKYLVNKYFLKKGIGEI